jgi:hypothetical protein
MQARGAYGYFKRASEGFHSTFFEPVWDPFSRNIAMDRIPSAGVLGLVRRHHGYMGSPAGEQTLANVSMVEILKVSELS